VFHRFRLLLALGVANLLIGALLRAWLSWQFGIPAGVGAADLPLVLAGGLLNDTVAALYLLCPLAVYTALLPDRWYRSGADRGGWRHVGGVPGALGNVRCCCARQRRARMDPAPRR
jgi:hypothetical protein